MLRFEYMPSTFNALFLFLGGSNDLQSLASVLKDFGEQPRRLSLREVLKDTEGLSEVELIHEEGPSAPYGMRPGNSENWFEWVLNAWQAEQVAARINALSSEELLSGNDVIELGITGEVPVKISRGEFTDDFLTPRHELYVGKHESHHG